MEDHGLAFDVSQHLGTLVAVIALLGEYWVNLIHPGITNPNSTDGKLFWFIAAASIPGAIIGNLFEKQSESAFRNLGLIGMMLIIIGIVSYMANKIYDGKVTVEDIGFKRSFFIGLSQVLAIIPGVSRFGITMKLDYFLVFQKEVQPDFHFFFLLQTYT
ncbi:undecaprenyl-diphosphate phosphatase [Clostridium beijerinckii]|uniref:undecaprenyl-diphosphate phosphatase n=1 Tax=Clostridium beijerinckii TaxID=1520 RepID=UPI0006869249|nr:undecaprenyl-diphosphate phosphatase [Clostridium beijerinckii]